MGNVNEYLTDVAFAVRKFGGLEKAARFLDLEQESLDNYARTGYLPEDLAKKLGRVTGINWKFLRSPN